MASTPRFGIDAMLQLIVFIMSIPNDVDQIVRFH